MNASDQENLNLIEYSTVLSFLIFFNYFLWSINSWEILKSINFFILFTVFIYFFISKKFTKYWYLKLIIIILLLICLGSPTISYDARTFFLFPSKILFYESDLYFHLGHNIDLVNFHSSKFADVVFSRPKLASSLSATFAQILGFWNDIFPKSTNIIIIFPPIIFLISFFKNKSLSILWLFLLLLLSGKLLVNGLMDGLLALYFVSSVLIAHKVSHTAKAFEKKLLYFLMFLFFSILTLIKHEGLIMVLVILLSCICVDIIYRKKFNYNLFIIGFLSIIPIIFWKFNFLISNYKNEWVSYGSPINRIFDKLTNLDDLTSVFLHLIFNEKLIISLFLFIYFSFKFFKENKKLILYTSIVLLFYFFALIAGIFISTHTVETQLLHSGARIFIPLALMLSFFAVFLINDNYKAKI